MATCGAPTDGDGSPCGRRVGVESARCFLHDESGVPSSHGAPTGNDNAVGNAGGGPSVGNTNARKHGGFSSLDKFRDRLGDEEREAVESMADEIARDATVDDLSEERIAEKAERAALMIRKSQHTGAHADQGVGDGWLYLDDGEAKVNPAERASGSLMNQSHRILRRLGVYDMADTSSASRAPA